MKHEEASLQTRKALSAALKDQMKHKPLRKITVNDLIGMCGLNRKTFYYHFTDIYDLLKWTLEQETVEVIRQFDLMTNYHDAILFVMNYAEENAHILNCAYDSMGRDELKRFFCGDFYEIVDDMIDRCAASEHCQISAFYHDFLRDFYTEALGGTLEILQCANPILGRVLGPNGCTFSGRLQTPVSIIPYQADCILFEDSLQGTFHTVSGDYAVQGTKAGPAVR